MADLTTRIRYESWEDFYLKKKEETGGFIHQLAKKKLSVFDKLPIDHFDKPSAFKTAIASSTEGNFILIPVEKKFGQVHPSLLCL